MRLIAVVFAVAALLGGSFAGSASARDVPVPASMVLLAGSVGGKPAYACGVIVRESGATVRIITAGHNLQIERPEVITVAGERLNVESSGRLGNSDLAVIVTGRPRRAFEVAVLAPQPAIGDRVLLWGPIKREPFTLHEGRVRAVDPRVTDAPPGGVALDCAQCDHGDSGTGIFDERGRLVAVVTTGYYLGGVKLMVLGETTRPDAALATMHEVEKNLGSGRQDVDLRPGL